MANGVLSYEALHDGLRNELMGTFRQINQSNPNVKKVTLFTDAKGRVDLWYYRTGVSKPGYIGPNGKFPKATMGERKHKTVTRDFGLDISWKRTDREDDKTQTLYQDAKQIGEGYATFPDEFMIQVITGASDYRLLPVIPKTPDGAGLFSATEGNGSARFRLSGSGYGGNLLTGGGVTPIKIREDFFKVKNLMFAKMKKPNGEDFIYSDNRLKRFMIMYSPELDEAMQEAFKQKIVLDTAGVSNIMIDSNNVPELWMNNRLSGNSYYIFNLDADVMPFIFSTHKAVDTIEYNRTNSDLARFNRLEGILTEYRVQYGLAEAYGVVKVSNS